MIRISFNKSDVRVVEALRTKGLQVADALEDTLDRLMLELQRRIQRKLSGDVLQQRSGKLLGSVNKQPTRRDGSRIVGGVTAAGGPAFYGRIQSAGSANSYEILPKNKKALAFFPGGSVGGAIAGGSGLVPGKSVVRGLTFRSGAQRGALRPASTATFGQLGGIVVRRVIHPPIKARPFMGPALAEMQQEIVSRLYASAAKALRA